jgi:hypothetical protein
MLAALTLAAVLLNWMTTGDHLVRTVFLETYWPVAGLDLSLLVTSVLAMFAGRVLMRRERGVQATRVSTAARSAAAVDARHA